MSSDIPAEVSESSQKKSASDHWFDEVNHKAASQIDGLGDDPPFFLDNVDAQIGEKHVTAAPDPEDPILSYMRTNDWERENEDLRGIIDDLTLDVKRMKRKLRRYREANPRHLRNDKLFEIRAHSLSVRRKRQLEDILERFAADISVPPRLSKDKSLPKANSLLSEEAHMGMLVMLIECLCSPTNTSHHTSSLKSSLLQGNQDGWFSINEMLRCIQQASSAVSQHKLNLETLKQHSTRLDISTDGNYLRWKATKDGPVDSRVTHQVDNQDFSKSRASTRVPLGFDKMDVMSTIKKDPYYTPSAFLQYASEAEADRLSMTNSETGSATQFTVVHPNPQMSKSPKLSSSGPHGRTAYYKNASFYIDYSCDSIDHADICHDSPRSGKKRKRRRPSESHVSNRFAAYHTEHKEDNDKQHEPSSPGLSLNEVPLSPITDGTRPQPIELEASGVGGVIPSDNFAVHVTVKHTSFPDSVHTTTTSRVPDNRLSKNRIIPRPEIHSTLKAHVVASTHEELAPSSLPPPTYGVLSSDSSDDEDESSPSELSYSGYGVDKPTHALSIQKWRAEVVSSLEHDTDGAVSRAEDVEAT